jgi:hypothetical protein
MPEKFDLEKTLTLHPNVKLQTAFELAKVNFEVEQLLDPEDVNCTRPDKKSILM